MEGRVPGSVRDYERGTLSEEGLLCKLKREGPREGQCLVVLGKERLGVGGEKKNWLIGGAGQW